MSDGPADTFGVPWAGRELAAQPYAGDDGTADRALAVALDGAAAGTVSVPDVVRALAGARVLVPVMAVLGEDHPTEHVRGDLGAEMATVTVATPDGRLALPVFTSVEALARWDAGARPVPVTCRQAAAAAVEEGCEVLLLDAAGPVRFGVPRAAVWALGEGRDWVPPAQDGDLLAALEAAVRPVPDVLGLRLEPVSDSGVRIVLGVRRGLDRAALDTAVHAARSRLAEVELLTERADAVELKILPA